MDSRTKQQVSRICSYWKWGGLLMGIFIGSFVTRLLVATEITSAVIAWRFVAPLCLLGGAALSLLAHRKYNVLAVEGPIEKGFLPHS